MHLEEVHEHARAHDQIQDLFVQQEAAKLILQWKAEQWTLELKQVLHLHQNQNHLEHKHQDEEDL